MLCRNLVATELLQAGVSNNLVLGMAAWLCLTSSEEIIGSR